MNIPLRDHLGNSRVSCRCGDPKRGEDGNILSGEAAGTDSVTVVQENHYDPWGLSFGSATESQTPKGLTNRYQYNGKEKIADMDLGWSDYGARMYDPSIGRWNVVNPLADQPEQIQLTPYNSFWDNPVNLDDPDGRCPNCGLAAIGAGVGAIFGGGLRQEDNYIIMEKLMTGKQLEVRLYRVLLQAELQDLLEGLVYLQLQLFLVGQM